LAREDRYLRFKNMADESSEMSVLSFVAASAQGRATRYREHAAQLRKIAKAAFIGRLRHELLRLADEFESLADRIELSRFGG
jgi:hypothetical protein